MSGIIVQRMYAVATEFKTQLSEKWRSGKVAA